MKVSSSRSYVNVTRLVVRSKTEVTFQSEMPERWLKGRSQLHIEQVLRKRTLPHCAIYRSMHNRPLKDTLHERHAMLYPNQVVLSLYKSLPGLHHHSFFIFFALPSNLLTALSKIFAALSACACASFHSPTSRASLTAGK